MSEPPPPGAQAPAAGPGAGGLSPPGRKGPTGLGPLGIVAGSGAFPGAVADAAIAEGREVILFLIQGFADPALERYAHVWFRLGSLGKVAAMGRARGIRDLVMVGGLTRPRLRDLGFDLTMLRLLPRIARLFRGGDNHLLSGVLELVQEQGFHLVGAHEVAPRLLLPEGVLGSCRPSPVDEADMAKGLAVIRTLGPYDVGQAVIVADGWVVAVEAAEGTDQMLARFGEMRRSGRIRLAKRQGVLVKAPKPGQDRRIDLPSLGTHTVERAAAVGLAGIAFEARGAIVPDVETLVAAADAAGLFVMGMAAGAAARTAGTGADGGN